MTTRHIEVINTDGQVHRLTFAPATGRITLKIINGTSKQISKMLLRLAEMIKNDAKSDNHLTIRGVVNIHENDCGCSCQMVSKGKKGQILYSQDFSVINIDYE